MTASVQIIHEPNMFYCSFFSDKVHAIKIIIVNSRAVSNYLQSVDWTTAAGLTFKLPLTLSWLYASTSLP